MRIHHQQPADFTVWLGPVSSLGGLLGVAAGTALSNLARRRGGGHGATLWIAAIASLVSVPAAGYSLMAALIPLATLFAILCVTSFMVIVVVVIVINLHIPNELRGLVQALQVVTIGLSGATSPGLVAIVNRALGGDAMLGTGMAIVATLCWLAVAGCYWLASRARQSRSAATA